MTEINEYRYKIIQNNKVYILSTSLINDKIKLVCKEYSNSQIFDG